MHRTEKLVGWSDSPRSYCVCPTKSTATALTTKHMLWCKCSLSHSFLLRLPSGCKRSSSQVSRAFCIRMPRAAVANHTSWRLMAIRDSWSHAGPCCVNQAKVGMGSAHLRLSFGVLQDCHGVGVWGRMAHDGWSKHSSQVTDVHPSFCSGSDSARVEGA